MSERPCEACGTPTTRRLDWQFYVVEVDGDFLLWTGSSDYALCDACQWDGEVEGVVGGGSA